MKIKGKTLWFGDVNLPLLALLKALNFISFFL